LIYYTSFQSPLNKQQSLELLLILLGLFCCVARVAEARPTPPPETGTGLEGSIFLHSISGGPVKQGVPDSKPLANTTFDVKKGDLTVASFTTDDQGRFRISLPPGHYSISKKDWKSRVGYYGPFEVDIAAGQIKKVQWNCDTGMQ
jgi:Prealbumin-like fold domain